MVAIDNYMDTKKEYDISTKRLQYLEEQVKIQKQTVDDLKKTLKEIEDILKDLTGIEVSLFKEIVRDRKQIKHILEILDKENN